MIKNIAKGYGHLFISAGKVLLLLALCIALGCVIVFPLWKFATSLPGVYSAVVLALIAAALIFIFAKKARTAGFSRTISVILRILLIAAALVACIALVMAGKRFFAIPVLAAAFILYGILSFGIRKPHDKTEN